MISEQNQSMKMCLVGRLDESVLSIPAHHVVTDERPSNQVGKSGK